MSSGIGIIALTALFMGFSAHGAPLLPQNFTVEGRFFEGTVPMNRTVNVQLDVLVQGSSCILYTEHHNGVNVTGTAATAGFYALPLGSGTSQVNLLSDFSKVFSNSEDYSLLNPNCSSINLLNKARVIRISVDKDQNGTFVTLSPDTVVTSVPTALVAETLNGKTQNDFVQLKDDMATKLSQANIETVFSATNYPRLQQLLSPSAAVGFNGQRLSDIADPSAATDAATKGYSDTKLAGQTIDLVDVAAGFGGGKVLTWDQTAAKWVATSPALSGTAGGDLAGTYPNPTIANLAIGTSKLADGAVASAKINATGIAPNRILITDNLSGGTVTYAACANNEVLKFVTGTGWQCASVASMSAVTSVNTKTGAVVLNGADLGLGTASMRDIGVAATNVPELDGGGKLAAGVMPGFTGDLSGAYTSAFVAGIQGRAVASTLPNANEVLRWNGTLTRWEPSVIVDTGITALTGDISATGSGTVAATLTNGVVTTPKMFATPGANRLVATDGTSGATLVPFVCNLNESLQWSASGWACVNPSIMIGGAPVYVGGNTVATDLSIGTSNNFGLNVKTNGASRITVLNAGNVGIGTTSPQRLLDVVGSMRLLPGPVPATPMAGDLAFDNSFGNALRFHNGSSWVTVGNGNGDFLANGTVPMTGNLRLNNRWLSGDGGNEGVYVDANGLVGIGTATPGYALDVNGTANVSGAVNVGTSVSAQKFIAGVGPGLPTSYGFSDSSNTGLFSPSTGAVSLGASGVQVLTMTNTSASLSRPTDVTTNSIQNYASAGSNPAPAAVSSTQLSLTNTRGADDNLVVMRLAVTNAALNGQSAYLGAVSSAGAGVHTPSIVIGQQTGSSSYAERMRIDANGNVGIGTTSPARLLEVGGSIRVRPSALPATPGAGDLAFDSAAANSLKYHNGVNWVSIGTGTGDFMAAGTVPMTGQLRAFAGTAGIPGLTFNNDTDTGVFSPAADTVAIGTSGSEKVRVFANGNVSFGNTVAGNDELQVYRDQDANTNVTVSNPNTGTNVSASSITTTGTNTLQSTAYGDNHTSAAGLAQISAGGTTNSGLRIQTTTSQPILFSTNLVERLRVTSTGSVGIGTSSPNRLLEVAGPIRIAPAALPGSPGAGDFAIDSGAGNSLKYHNGTSWISLAVGGTGDFKSDGSVAMTGALRHLAGTAASPGMTFTGDTSTGIFAPTVNNLALSTAGNERLRVLANGNVGIGTTAPTGRLEVAAGGSAAPVIISRVSNAGEASTVSFFPAGGLGASNPAWMQGLAQSKTNYSISTFDGTTVTDRFVIDTTGNVGIGLTNPTARLAVGSNILVNGVTIGRGASNVATNLAIGTTALNSGGGSENTAIGNGALLNASGTYNTALGINAGNSLTAGNSNTIIGSEAGANITNGSNNILLGRLATTPSPTTSSFMNLGNLIFATNMSGSMSSPTGFVGIGTTSPARLFEVAGAMRITPAAVPASPGAGDLAVDSSNSNSLKFHNGTSWITLGTGNTISIGIANYIPKFTSGNVITFSALYDSGGSIGVGTTSPSRLLHVAGPMKITPSGPPLTPLAGDIFVDSLQLNQLKYHNGSLWVTVGSGDFKADGTVPMTGSLRHVAGTSSSPGLTFDGDTDNGIFAPAADQLAFTTSGTEKIRLLTNGNVGIGTTSPVRKLDVAGSIRVQPAALPGSPVAGDIAIDSSSGNSFKYHNGSAWQTVNTGSGDFRADGTVAMAGNLRLNNNYLSGDGGNEGIFVDSSGNVAIGFTAPNAPLDVAGSIFTSNGLYANGVALKLGVSGNPNITVSPTGNVGVGVTNPTSAFQAAAVGGQTTNYTGHSFSNGTTSATPSITKTGLDIQSTGAWNGAGALNVGLNVNATGATTNYAALFNGGSVGIGTTGPARTLDVNGVVRLRPSPAPASPSGGDLFVDQAAANVLKYHNGTNWQIVNTGSGDFRADGTLPMTGSLRHVAGSAATPGMTFDGDTDNGIFAPAPDQIAFTTSGTEKMRMLANGNIGLGTSSPGFELELRKDGVAHIAVNSYDSGSSESDSEILLRRGRGSQIAPQPVLTNDRLGGIFFHGEEDTNPGISLNNSVAIIARAEENWSTSAWGSSISFSTTGQGTTNRNERVRISGNGNLGIGTTSPNRLLDVAGSIHLSPSALPGTPIAGDLAIDSGAGNSLKYHNGTSWISLAGGALGDFKANGTVAMSGQLRSIAGTASAPGLTFAGDTANGIFAPAANNFAISTLGAERLRVLANGNIGIGTSSPSDVFEIQKAQDASTLVKLTNASTGASATAGVAMNNGNGDAFIEVTSTGLNPSHLQNRFTMQSAAAHAGISLLADGSGDIRFYTGGISPTEERARLSGAGLGIGVTTIDRRLHVAGPIRINPSALPASPSAGDIAIDSGTGNTLKYHDGGAWRTITTGTGFALAGTNTDITSLNGVNSILAPGASGALNIGTSSLSGSITIGNSSTGPANFGNTGTGSVTTIRGGSGTSGGIVFSTSGTAGYSFLGTGNFSVGSLGTGANISMNPGTAGSISIGSTSTGNSMFGNSGGSSQTIVQAGGILNLNAPLTTVSNAFKITPASLPGSPAAGFLAFDQGAGNALKFHNGSVWQTVGTGTGDFKADGSVPMSGVLRSTAGSAPFPGFTFIGDTDNGIYSPSADNVAIATSGVERFRISGTGNVGIGLTTTSTNKFQVAESSSATAGEVVTNLNTLTVFPVNTSTATFYSTRNRAVRNNSASNSTAALYGSENIAENAGAGGTLALQVGAQNTASNASGVSSQMFGARNSSQLTLSGSATEAYGAYNEVKKQVSPTLAASYGSYNASQNSVGITTDSFGSYNTAEQAAPSASTNLYGSYNRAVMNNASGSVTNAYGVYAETFATGGTITNGFGVYVGTVNGTNRYSLYTADASAPSVISGSLNIGTTMTTQNANITGTTQFGGNVVQKVSGDFTTVTTAINWNTGTIQATAKDCAGAAGDFTFTNLKNGGSYTLIVGPTTSSTNICVFPSTIDSVPVTYRFMPANSARVANTNTIYNFLRAGDRIYVTWTTGF